MSNCAIPNSLVLFGASVTSGVWIIFLVPPKLRVTWTAPVLLPFTLVHPLLAGLSAPTARLRFRILAFSTLFAICCNVTFFSGAGTAEPPPLARLLLFPAAVIVPYAIRRVLATSKSDNGIAALVLPYVAPPALVAGSAYWFLEWLDASGNYMDLRHARTALAWTSVVATFGGIIFWMFIPVALHISTELAPRAQQKTEVRVLGFANAFGAPFSVFWALALASVWLAAQPTAQITLALATAALLALLELVDVARDTRAIHASFADPASALARLEQQQNQGQAGGGFPAAPVSFDEIALLALLAQLAFFASRHQATLVSVQWKSVFVLTPTVSYPFSPLLVILNAFGPTALIALAAPLNGIWNVAPNAQGSVVVTSQARRLAPRCTSARCCLAAR
ncbi:hypothetical protein V8E53_012445 [Lactarius tabidus]